LKERKEIKNQIIQEAEMLFIMFLLTSLLFFYHCYRNSANLVTTIHKEREDCDYYITLSTLHNVGRKVIAGKDFVEKDFHLYGPTIFIPQDLCHRTALSNYVFGSAQVSTSLLMMSPVSIMNHSPKPNIEHYWNAHPGADPELFPEVHSANLKCFVQNTHNISKGEEMFVSYGENWFTHRNFLEEPLFPEEHENGGKEAKDDKKNEEKKKTIEELEKKEASHYKSVCLSDVNIKRSRISSHHQTAGNGLFAKRAFQKDELITVSPVLLLEYHHLLETYYNISSLLMIYSFYKSRSSVALLPLGLSSMMNHYEDLSGLSHGLPGSFAPQKTPSVYVDWFHWNASAAASHERVRPFALSLPLDHLLSMPFAPLDLAFYANRAIEEGEELTLDYGPEWVAAYQYSEAKTDPSVPFLHWIGGADDLFPDDWMVGGKYSMKYEL
jgi:hypothetical protein